jgi:SdrD B-like domain/Dockerin type I domain
MQPYSQAFFGKICLFSVVCILAGLTPQYVKAQACTNTYRVWMDCDADGQKGVFENGLQGVNVTLYDANCVQLQQVTTNASGLYTFGNLSASKAYYAVFGNNQYAHNVLNVNNKSHNLSPSNVGAEATDSDARLGGVAPTCANGKPYISFTTNALGCVDGLLDAGFTRLDFQLNSVNVVHETCGGNRNGSISINLTAVEGGYSTTITGSTPMANVPTYNNLAPGTYTVDVRSLAPVCNSFYRTTVTINAGPTVTAPTVTDDKVCRYQTVPQNGGLKATCTPCGVGFTPTVTWWTAQSGGYKVYTGSTFDPIANNWVNTSLVGTATFWAQCECNGCVSPRTRANFVIQQRPAPIVSGEKLPCPDAVQTYTTPSVLGSNYVWTLPDGGGTIVSANNNSVTVRWNNVGGTGPFRLHVAESCSESADFIVSIKSTQLTCVGSLNATLNEQCQYDMTNATLLSQNYIGSETYTYQLKTTAGVVLEQGIGHVLLDGVADNGTPYILAGQEFIYTVIEPCGGSLCWGNIRFEDKTAPIISCPDNVTLACSQVQLEQTPSTNLTGTPSVSDCSTTTTDYTDIVRDVNCQQPFSALPSDLAALKAAVLPSSGDIVRIILRTFLVKDISNNVATCKQYIFIRKGSIQNIICPKDTVIDCQNYGGDNSIDPSVIGMPILDVDGDLNTTYDRYPIGTGSCKMELTHTNQRTNLCTNSFKLVRTWRIYDPCAVDNPATATDERVKICVQTITIADKTPPSVSAAFTQYYTENGDLYTRDTTVAFDGYADLNNNTNAGTLQDVYALGNNAVCGGKARFVFQMKDDNCTRKQVVIRSDDSRVRMSVGYPRFDAATGETIAIFEASYNETGDYDVIFTASDECGFIRAKKTFRVKVRDNVRPNVVCKSYTTTSLTTNGSVRVLAESFNSNSTDNCGVKGFAVRRTANCQNPADTVFMPYVDFNCCDVNTTQQAVFRIWDYEGNYNECMVSIFVNDKIKPICVAPANKTISCVDYTFSALQNFGKPDLNDNCHIKDTIYTETERVDNCKVGSLLRKWVITDGVGLKDSCQQLITIRGKSDFTVDFPDDMFVSCFDAVPTREQAKAAMINNPKNKDGHIINDGCGILAVEVTDDTLTATPDACYKILRKISVIDWCKYNPNNYDVNTSCYGKPVCGDVHNNPNWAAQNIPSWQHLVRPACTTPSERTFRDADELGGTTLPYSPYCFSDGLICYTQVIKVVDNIAPVFTSYAKDTTVKSFVLGCSDTARLTVMATDLCAEGQATNANYLVFKWILIDSATNTTVKTGFGNTFLSTFDYGKNYRVVWSVEDRCGNRTYCEQKVRVKDAKSPSILCRDINVELGTAGIGIGMAQVPLSSLSPMSLVDNCTPNSYLVKHLTIERDATSAGTYPFPIVSGSATASDTTLMFTCIDANLTIPVRVWSIDEAGNGNYCLSKVRVQDNLNACTQLIATVTGVVKTDNNDNIAGVTLTTSMNGVATGSGLSNATGNFSINNLIKGNNYAIRATREDAQVNGVTTFDVALMSKHILGTTPLSTPYKIIAADVNRDGDITAVDMLHTRRMVLRLQTAFPNGTPAWRFVDKAYRFNDPTNPLAEDFPEVVNISNMPTMAQADFIGIKVGDVNGNASVIARGAPKDLIFNTDDKVLEAGKEYRVVFKCDDFNAQSYQFTLNFTDGTSRPRVLGGEGVEVVNIESGQVPDMAESNFGRFKTALTTSWNGQFEGQTDNVFTLVLRAKQNAQLSDVLNIGSNLTAVEAYDKDGGLMNVKLVFNGKNTEGASFTLYQNEPNPFNNQTKVGFNLPNESMVKLTVYDVAGRVLKTIEQKCVKGYNEIQLSKEDINTTGVLYYRLDTPTHSATRKMVRLE